MHLAKKTARYLVINKSDKLLMVMRPYQVYAIESLMKRASETKNNGYIWHIAGPGKILTSLESSHILTNEPHVKKSFS